MRKNLHPEKLFHRDVFLTAVFAMLFYFVLQFFFHLVNTHFVDPLTTSIKDFEFSDIYFSQYAKHQAPPDTNIILINTGIDRPAFRNDLARMILVLKKFKPKVIAVDHYFPEKDSIEKNLTADSLLQVAVASFPELISICRYYPDSPDANYCRSASDKKINLVNEGYSNLVARNNETVRYFMPYIRKKINGEEKHFESFALKTVKAFDSTAYQYTINNNKSETAEWIQYGRKDNYWYEPPEILRFEKSDTATQWLNDSAAFRNAVDHKIVLFGFLGMDKKLKTLEDIYVTPSDKILGGVPTPGTYGVEIQAHIVSTLLGKNFIWIARPRLLHLIGFLLLLPSVYLFLWLYVKHPAFFHAASRAYQIVISAGVVVISLLLFGECKIDISAKTVIMPLLLSVDAIFLFDFLVQQLKKKFHFKTYYSHEH